MSWDDFRQDDITKSNLGCNDNPSTWEGQAAKAYHDAMNRLTAPPNTSSGRTSQQQPQPFFQGETQRSTPLSPAEKRHLDQLFKIGCWLALVCAIAGGIAAYVMSPEGALHLGDTVVTYRGILTTLGIIGGALVPVCVIALFFFIIGLIEELIRILLEWLAVAAVIGAIYGAYWLYTH